MPTSHFHFVSGEHVGRASNALGKLQSRARNSDLYGSTQGLAGHVAQTKTSMNIPQLNLENRFDAGIDLKFDFEGQHSFVSCPLLLQTGECMGVIQLVKKGLGQFSEHHIRLLHIVCVQAAMVLRNRTHHESLLRSSLEHVIHVTESVMWCLKPDTVSTHCADEYEGIPARNICMHLTFMPFLCLHAESSLVAKLQKHALHVVQIHETCIDAAKRGRAGEQNYRNRDRPAAM